MRACLRVCLCVCLCAGWYWRRLIRPPPYPLHTHTHGCIQCRYRRRLSDRPHDHTEQPDTRVASAQAICGASPLHTQQPDTRASPLHSPLHRPSKPRSIKEPLACPCLLRLGLGGFERSSSRRLTAFQASKGPFQASKGAQRSSSLQRTSSHGAYSEKNRRAHVSAISA